MDADHLELSTLVGNVSTNPQPVRNPEPTIAPSRHSINVPPCISFTFTPSLNTPDVLDHVNKTPTGTVTALHYMLTLK